MLSEIELSCLDSLGAGTLLNPVAEKENLEDRWLEFMLRTALDAGARLRASRSHPEKLGFKKKQDGSPVTQLEKEIEEDLRERLMVFDPHATLLGEETGGEVGSKGFGVAVEVVTRDTAPTKDACHPDICGGSEVRRHDGQSYNHGGES